jgi:hypothetical protein
LNILINILINPIRNLSPHIVADIATSKVIAPHIIIINFITFGSPSHITAIVTGNAGRVVNTPPRIVPKMNLKMNTVISILCSISFIHEPNAPDQLRAISSRVTLTARAPSAACGY